MIIWISRELPLSNFEHLDELCPRLGHPSEKLWPFEFLERFRCSISSVSIYYVPKSDIRVKIYDHLNFSRGSVVQFRASRYIMSPNRTSVWKVMTIWNSRDVSLYNFDRVDILCPKIRHPCEKWWPIEFHERFCCSISSVSINYVPESDIRVKSYDHLNFSRGSVIQFRVSRYIISQNQTSVWKDMTIWNSREVSLFNFEHLDILCPRIGHHREKSRPLNLSRAFVVQFLASRYIMSPNQTSVWKAMTIRISRELPLFNFERLDILCSWIGHPSEIYDHSNFSRSSVVQFWTSRWVMSPNQTSVWKVMTNRISQALPLFNFESLDILYPRIGHPCKKVWPFKFLESFRCSISSVSIYYVHESDIRVKCYDHSNFSSASIVQFRESRYIISPNRTSVCKGMTIQISRKLPLFNFERLDILCPRIRHPSEMLWPFEFLGSFRCSISSALIYCVPESNIRVTRFSLYRSFTADFSNDPLT